MDFPLILNLLALPFPLKTLVLEVSGGKDPALVPG